LESYCEGFGISRKETQPLEQIREGGDKTLAELAAVVSKRKERS